MKYEVISKKEPIRAGEIRVEFKPESYATITRYTRNIDYSSAQVIETIDLFKYVMASKWRFIADIKNILVRCHFVPRDVRITDEVMEVFSYEDE